MLMLLGSILLLLLPAAINLIKRCSEASTPGYACTGTISLWVLYQRRTPCRRALLEQSLVRAQSQAS
jgi:hypothetical protein